jgi:CHAD domain-containing protein
LTQTPAIVVTAIVSVAMALGLAYAVFRTSARTNIAELYERENDALGKSNERLEKDLKHATEQLGDIRQKFVVLEAMITQRAEVKELREMVERIERIRGEEHATFLTILKDVLAQLRSGRGTIGG